MPEQRDGEMNNLETLGRRLRRARRRADLTQDELAAILTRLTGRNLTVPRISKYEHGVHEPRATLCEAWFAHCKAVAETLDKA